MTPDEPHDPRGGPGVGAVRVAVGMFVALAVAAVVILLIGRAAGFGKIRTTLRDGEVRWLAVCAAGQVVVFAGYASALRRAIASDGGPQLTGTLALRVVLTSFAVSQLLAAGGAAGLVITYWALRRLGLDRRAAAVRLIGLNTLVYFVFAVIGWAAAVLSLRNADAPLGATLPWITAVPVLWLAALWFTDERRVQRWATPHGGVARQAISTGVAAAAWTRQMFASRQLPMIGAAALYWVGDIASLWGALNAFGEAPSIAALGLVYTTGYLAQAVPIPFIATGGMDAAMTFGLQMVGVPLDVALVAVIAHRIFAFWIPLVPGLVLAAFVRRTAVALDRVSQAAPAGDARRGDGRAAAVQ